MFRKLVYILLLLGTSSAAFAQDIDSTTLVNAQWTKERIAKKTKLVRYQFKDNSLFKANQMITYIEVKNPGKNPVFGFGYADKELKTTPVFAEEQQAFAAINGTFFDIKNGGSVDFLKVDGKIINENRLEKDQKRALHQKAAIIIDNGQLSLTKWDGTTTWEERLTSENVMQSGPLLIYEKKTEKLDSVPFNKLRHPRTAIGIKPDGKVILLTVDGRQDNSAGVSLFELEKIMRWLGCSSAINLDGGGSTTLWVSSKTQKGIVNYPSDNKKWDHEGARKVANIIFVRPKGKK